MLSCAGARISALRKSKMRCIAILQSPTSQWRSEEHTSELQSLMRISYAVFCLKKKNNILPFSFTHLHSLLSYTLLFYLFYLLFLSLLSFSNFTISPFSLLFISYFYYQYILLFYY